MLIHKTFLFIKGEKKSKYECVNKTVNDLNILSAREALRFIHLLAIFNFREVKGQPFSLVLVHDAYRLVNSRSVVATFFLLPFGRLWVGRDGK